MNSFTNLFRHICQSYPLNPAVITNGVCSLTYTQLDQQAQTIAAYLHEMPSGIIGLSIEKSADYIAAMMGCWYAGRAFLPLDPTLPPERRDFIVQDAKPAVILTQSQLKKLPECTFTPLPLDVKTIAYVIYTSGSTGTPKGIVVSHRGLTGMLQAQIKAFGLHPDSRSLFYLSTSFDASISDIGTALLSGAALCIETAGKLETAAYLSEIIRKRGITYMDIPPSLLKLLDPKDLPPSLESVVIGGEVCPPDIVRSFAKSLKIINVYGPTEATICTSLCLCDARTWNKPLIGAPLPDVAYHIFDTDMNPCDEGELYIGGTQLAVGYLNNPALTERKFIMHQGQRLYKTGDLIRRHANGDLEFCGRIDRQFKLNGQLVEPEEIEEKIARISGVARVAVILRLHNDRPRLSAFVQMTEGYDLKTEWITAPLRLSLPQWMIPSDIIFLDRIPQTPSGKNDLAALKNYNIETRNAQVSSPFVPNDAYETMLYEAWKRILRKDSIGCDDNFFMLGGDSVAVIDLSLTAERSGARLTPDMISAYPTITLQSQIIRQGSNNTHAIQAGALKKDVALDEEWKDIIARAENRPRIKPHEKNVFMTGATGFLGQALLQELLAKTDFSFHLLVRAKTQDEGFKRTGIDQSHRSRIHIVTGDVAAPFFGLSINDWKNLTETIDIVIHNAATVNVVKSYAELRAVNVEGTKTAARLALEGKRKKLHYTSTLSVFVSTDRNTGIALETDWLENTTEVYGGYAQSKWAAEYFLHQIPRQACDISIYRLGLITGDRLTGAAASHDFLSLFIRGVMATGAVPMGSHDELFVDITPVDHAVCSMSRIILSGEPGVFHIANTKGFSLADILRGLDRAGIYLESMPPDEWRKRMAKDIFRNNALSSTFMALCRLMPGDAFAHYRAMDLFQATGIAFDMQKSLAITGLPPPKADEKLMDLYLKNIITAG